MVDFQGDFRSRDNTDDSARAQNQGGKSLFSSTCGFGKEAAQIRPFVSHHDFHADARGAAD
jgi:hypothetical protein